MLQQIEVHDKDGNLVKVEVYKPNGEHLLDFLYDERDPQDHDHRVAFREWITRHLKQGGYE